MKNKKRLQGFIYIILGLLVIALYLYQKRLPIVDQGNEAVQSTENIQPVTDTPKENVNKGQLSAPSSVGADTGFKGPVKLQ